MLMNVKCPLCGHACRMPESSLGQPVQCPACAKLFQCGTLSPRSLVTIPLPNPASASPPKAPPVRGVKSAPDQSIHYLCSRCNKPLASPAAMAGQKLNCPDCKQRLQIPPAAPPQPSSPQPSSPQPWAVVAAPAPTTPAPVAEEVILEVAPVKPPPPARRRESCLECGVDVTQRPRVQTCPDCGSIFCSAMCYREHRYHAHPGRR